MVVVAVVVVAMAVVLAVLRLLVLLGGGLRALGARGDGDLQSTEQLVADAPDGWHDADTEEMDADGAQLS